MYASDLAATAYDLIQAARGKDHWAEATQVLAEVRRRCPEARSLLDVACGTGLHLQAFDELGLDVAGVELSPAMLDAARPRLPAGVPLLVGDMRTFRLDRRFDAVVCLFSAIGYMTTPEDLDRAVARMAAHVAAGGVLVVEPWIGPDEWLPGSVLADRAEAGGFAAARVSRSGREGDVGTFDLAYAVATPDRVDTFTEHHRTGLFTTARHRAAFEAAGLTFEHDPEGLTGRGLLVGTRAGA